MVTTAMTVFQIGEVVSRKLLHAHWVRGPTPKTVHPIPERTARAIRASATGIMATLNTVSRFHRTQRLSVTAVAVSATWLWASVRASVAFFAMRAAASASRVAACSWRIAGAVSVSVIEAGGLGCFFALLLEEGSVGELSLSTCCERSFTAAATLFRCLVCFSGDGIASTT